MWLSIFPVGVIGALLLLSLASVFGDVAAMLWGFVVFPHGAVYVCRHWVPRGPGSEPVSVNDTQTHYWRTSDWS